MSAQEVKQGKKKRTHGGANRKNGKFYIIIIVLCAVIALGAAFIYVNGMKQTEARTSISIKLEKAVDISDLSTSEFVYNGIAQRCDDEKPERILYYVSYNATVKVGIDFSAVEFKVDSSAKTITPILPEIKINSVSIEPDSIDFILSKTSVGLKEALTFCQQDVEDEVMQNPEVFDIAEENLRSTFEALLSPILDAEGYTIVWENN